MDWQRHADRDQSDARPPAISLETLLETREVARLRFVEAEVIKEAPGLHTEPGEASVANTSDLTHS